MSQLVAVALYHRDHFSHGNSRRVLGYEAYHWGIIIMLENSQERDWYAFDATDASDIDPVTFRMTNPKMDWWFRIKENGDPTLSAKLIGRIVIGKVSDSVSNAQLRDLFARVPLPVKNTHPQESCVTWAENAIRALQRQKWVESFEIDKFKNWALSYADERMKRSGSSEPSVKEYSVER